MKRLLAILGVFALLATLFVIATSASPASAGTTSVTVHNKGGQALTITAKSACGDISKPVGPNGGQKVFAVQQGCNYDFIGMDQAGNCLVGADYLEPEGDVSADVAPGPGDNVVNVDVHPENGATPDELWFFSWETDKEPGWCKHPDDYLEVAKFVPHMDAAMGSLTDFTIIVTPLNADFDAPQEGDGPCTASSTHTLTPDMPDGPGYYYDYAETKVAYQWVDGYANTIETCGYAVSELVPSGWSFDHYYSNCSVGFDDSITPTVIVVPISVYGDPNYTSPPCEVDFDNTADHIPLTVTKTFVGRDYYTTVDRADFHLNTPGMCGSFPFDPFGGLLGSVGVFRTINAAQDPQVVIWLPFVPGAMFTVGGLLGGEHTAGACTYRIQENNAPEGCTAVDPDGSTADGPYWEQTWAPGTTEFVFNIVNDCSPPPEPDPTPEVAPTTAPKGHEAGAKKPSSGGSTAPKFTG